MMNPAEAEEYHQKHKDHDIRLIVDLRDVVSKAQSEIARLHIENRELKGKVFDLERDLTAEKDARVRAQISMQNGWIRQKLQEGV